MDVELLWWAGCPSTERALADVRQALAELGLGGVSVRMTEIATDDEAATAGSPGRRRSSSTGRMSSRRTHAIGLSCRVYRRRDGRVSPTPDPDDLRDALRAATIGEVNRR